MFSYQYRGSVKSPADTAYIHCTTFFSVGIVKKLLRLIMILKCIVYVRFECDTVSL